MELKFIKQQIKQITEGTGLPLLTDEMLYLYPMLETKSEQVQLCIALGFWLNKQKEHPHYVY